MISMEYLMMFIISAGFLNCWENGDIKRVNVC